MWPAARHPPHHRRRGTRAPPYGATPYPCLSLRERWPSAARTESVGTFFRPAVRAGLPPLPAGSGIPWTAGRTAPRRAGPVPLHGLPARGRPATAARTNGRAPHPPTGSDNHRTTPRDAAATDPPKPNRGGGGPRSAAHRRRNSDCGPGRPKPPPTER